MLFSDDKVKRGFRMVKHDMNGLKQSVHDWVLFLNTSQQALVEKLEKTERRLKKLEMEKEQLNQWVY